MKDVLKALWEAWKECHSKMVEVTDKYGYCGDGQLMSGYCDELEKMMMWIMKNCKVDRDEEIEEIVELLEVTYGDD